MEPERKIEKLLRAYAKKRRADADASFKLHPATRRLLQGEVARRAPKPDAEDDSLSLWDLFRERWAVLVGFALIMFLGATLFLPALSKAKMRSKNAEAMSNLKQIGVAAQIAAVDNSGKLPATLDALTNELGSDRALTDTVSGQRFVYVAGGTKLDGLQSNDVLAYSPEDKKARAVLFADGSVRRVRREEFSALTNRGQLALALAENAPGRKLNETPVTVAVAAPAPAAAPPAAGEPAGIGGSADGATAPSASSVLGAVSTTGEFASAAASHNLAAGRSAVAQNSTVFKSELATNSIPLGLSNSQRFVQIATTKTPLVLASFEVQQNGSRISVVDRDGSIYNGTLQPAELAFQDDLSKGKAVADVRAGLPKTAQKDLGVAGNGLASAQNYSFRVSGANRSLRQNVVFVGNLIAISNVIANAAQNSNSGGGGQFQSATANGVPQQLFSNSRIAGMVTIDNTNQVEINALPVTP
jgi:hypothetical protein